MNINKSKSLKDNKPQKQTNNKSEKNIKYLIESGVLVLDLRWFSFFDSPCPNFYSSISISEIILRNITEIVFEWV